MTKHIVAIASFVFMLASAPIANAREGAALSGHWAGIIDEPGGEVARYTLSVHFNTDRNGAPVGVVRYDGFPCAGVWSNGVQSDGQWTFDETITENVPNCAPNAIIELTLRGDELDVRLAAVGFDGAPSTGRLQRRP